MQATITSTSTDQSYVGDILDALSAFIRQRPGLDFRDYGEMKSYSAEVRSIAKDKARAMTALRNVQRSITHDRALLLDSFRAYSGRLTWVDGESPRYKAKHPHLEYCAGQYFPTEYRKAAASVLETYLSALAQKWNAEHPQTFKFKSISDVRAANQAIGNHWFDKSSMRFFNTRIVSSLMTRGATKDHPGGRQVFITSERMDETRPLRYTIREALPNGEVDTIGEFQAYSSIEDAKDAIKYKIG